MRSTQVYRALDQIPNRFALCMSVSKGVHIIHKNGNSLGSSVATAFAGVESRELIGERQQPVAVLVQNVAIALPECPSVLEPLIMPEIVLPDSQPHQEQ